MIQPACDLPFPTGLNAPIAPKMIANGANTHDTIPTIGMKLSTSAMMPSTSPAVPIPLVGCACWITTYDGG